MKGVNATSRRRRRRPDDYFYERSGSGGREGSPSSEDSRRSVGPDDDDDAADAADAEYIVWDATRAAFDAWAGRRTRLRCRWRCCRCRHVNWMPLSAMTMEQCGNPATFGRPGARGGAGQVVGQGGGCPRDEFGEAHRGPGTCCVILVPRGAME
ncbi:hypothetical protein LX36DRAFT_720754 [Colletotrichum falcatum]|nr:hypothetical protein LX36DRAFT_720754 [Colletotrichum falcatum]